MQKGMKKTEVKSDHDNILRYVRRRSAALDSDSNRQIVDKTFSNVSDIATSTNMQSNATTSNSEKTTNRQMSPTSDGIDNQTLTYSVPDSLVNLSRLLESDSDSKIREERCFLKLLGVLGKSNHAYYCLKTSKGYYLTTKEIRLLPSLPRWMSWGTMQNGKCLTVRISESHKTGKGCSYSAKDGKMMHNIYGGFKEKKPREFLGISPTIRTPKGGGHLPMVVESDDDDERSV